MSITNKLVDKLATPYSLLLLLTNPAVNGKAKLKAALALGLIAFYILDPIDVIPDWTPLLGWLDDLVIVPLGMALADRLIPEVNVAAIRERARTNVKRTILWVVVIAGGLFLLGALTLAGLIYLIVHR